jgi:hypothetical protein
LARHFKKVKFNSHFHFWKCHHVMKIAPAGFVD